MQDTPEAQSNTSANAKWYTLGGMSFLVLLGGVFYVNDLQTPAPSFDPVVSSQPAPVLETLAVVTDNQEQQVLSTQVIESEPLIAQAPIKAVSPEPEPLPSLDLSDGFALVQSKNLLSSASLSNILIDRNVIRNFVTFVDNMSRGDVAEKYSPFNKPAQRFSIDEIAGDIYMTSASYQRYTPYVNILQSVDVDNAMRVFTAMLPLLDDAYIELGYESGEFTSALQQAIDELLLTPVIHHPIKLIAPSAMYQYADPQLENLPAIQKLMLRMGADNISKLQSKLKQIKHALEQREFTL